MTVVVLPSVRSAWAASRAWSSARRASGWRWTARSLQIGDGVAVIAVTSVAANLSTIIAGLAVFGDRLGTNALVVGVRLAAFVLILVGAALIPARVRAGEALDESTVEPRGPTASPA